MDEQNTGQTQVTTQQAPPAAPVEPTAVPVGDIEYASVWARFGAYLVDVIALGIVFGVFGIGTSGFADGSYSVQFGNLGSLLTVVYMIAMHVTMGATLGKMLLKIKVQDKDTGANVDWGKAILRDLVGAFLSALAVGLGFLWAFWDKEKQTWGDKFGNTIVVKTK